MTAIPLKLLSGQLQVLSINDTIQIAGLGIGGPDLGIGVTIYDSPLTLTNGLISLKHHTGFPRSELVFDTAALDVSTGGNQILWSFTLGDDTVYGVEAVVVARGKNGTTRGVFAREIMAYRQNGSNVTLGTPHTPYADDATVDFQSVAFSASGISLRLVVNVESGNDVYFVARIKYHGVNLDQ